MSEVGVWHFAEADSDLFMASARDPRRALVLAGDARRIHSIGQI